MDNLTVYPHHLGLHARHHMKLQFSDTFLLCKLPDERLWQGYLIYSLLSFIACLVLLGVWGLIKKIWRTVQGNYHSVPVNEAAPSAETKTDQSVWWADPTCTCAELPSHQTTSGKIIMVVEFLAGLTAFAVYLSLILRFTNLRGSSWFDHCEWQVDFTCHIILLVTFILRLTMANEKLCYLISIFPIINFLTIPTSILMLVCVSRPWIGLRFLRAFHILTVSDLLQLCIKLKSRSLRIVQVVCVLLSVLLAAIGIFYLVKQSTDRSFCEAEACVSRSTMMLQSLNTSADPCTDFFEYACGNWMTFNPIPPDQARWGIGEQMQKELFAKLRDLMESNPTDSSTARRKARQTYSACMNLTVIEETGSAPFLKMQSEFLGSSWPLLDPNWKADTFDYLQTFSKMSQEGQRYLANIYVNTDPTSPRKNILFFDETTLGLPSKKMYYQNSSEPVRKAYLALMKNLTLLLAKDAKAQVPDNLEQQLKDILNFEIEIANVSYTDEERRDPQKLVHNMKLSDFLDTYFNISFSTAEFLKAIQGIPLNSSVADAITLNMTVNVVNPSYYRQLDRILSNHLSDGSGKRLLANYLGWRALLNVADKLSKGYRDAKFEFDKVYSGVKAEAPRWRTCVAYTNLAFKLAMGSIFVDVHFKMDAKAKLMSLLKDVKGAFERVLRNSVWMDNETRSRALKKLHAMVEYIAYPDFILNDIPRLDKYYEEYDVHGLHFTNNRNIFAQIQAQADEELLKPGLRNADERLAPAKIDAYYNPKMNLIAFLAGIIQPPFFHKDYPDYLNYAALGQVFGHEITHGFDDRGSKYDEEGRLLNWWTNASRTNYLSRAKTIVEQYSQYNTSAGPLNGKLTAGENIADNGGVKEAYMAFKLYLSRLNDSSPLLMRGLDHMPIERVYFLATTQTWCGSYRPQYIKNSILSDVHSPFRFRAIGPLSNLPEFAQAFNCPVGSPMNPVKKAGVW